MLKTSKICVYIALSICLLTASIYCKQFDIFNDLSSAVRIINSHERNYLIEQGTLLRGIAPRTPSRDKANHGLWDIKIADNTAVVTLRTDIKNPVFILEYDPDHDSFVEPVRAVSYVDFLKDYGSKIKKTVSLDSRKEKTVEKASSDKGDSKSAAATEETARQTAGGASCPVHATSSSTIAKD